MGKIIAIGGGEIGRPKENGRGFHPLETVPIDKEIVRLSGRRRPKLLFISTASRDSSGYNAVIQRYFDKKLDCICDVLYLYKNEFTKKQIGDKILGADIIYVGGGNTLNMLNLWKRRGIVHSLKKTYAKGTVLTGAPIIFFVPASV